MRVLVLGGGGIQGKAAVHDLSNSPGVQEIICADANPDAIGEIADRLEISAIRRRHLDAGDPESLGNLMALADVTIDLLPRQYMETVCTAAIRAGVSVVNTNYGRPLAHLHEPARQAGVAILPECGLDPGIDLVLYAQARKHFDELHRIDSYCGGFPEPSACTNPLNYKISWVFEGVLASTKRDSRIIRDGQPIKIPAALQHDTDFVHEVTFPGLGTLEAIPNGDAIFFTDLLGVTDTIVQTGRYSLRWPGWSAFWRPLKQLHFLSDKPIAGLDAAVSPYQVLDKLLAPQLQYQRNEKDLVAMLNIFEGTRDGRKVRLTSRLCIERDLETGIMAMARGVGSPASIAAQMIASKEIDASGLLSPVKHIPADRFVQALETRGITIEEEKTMES